MSDPPIGPPDLFEASQPGEERELQLLEERLRAERPVPMDAFVAELRSRLLAGLPRLLPRVRRLVAAYATSGLALLAVATLGVAGAGPLAAG